MKKFFLSVINDTMVAIGFTMATFISKYSICFGIIAYFIACIMLDLHSYNDKKMNYPNNIFINKKLI